MRAIDRMRRVHLDDQLGQPPIIADALTTFPLRPNPRAVVATIGHQDPAQRLRTEAVTSSMDEREPFPGWGLMDQRFSRLPQDLILKLKAPKLAPCAAKLLP
jgi:hypothetical protein